MMLLWKILGIILALQDVHCTTRDTLAVEMSYQGNIMSPGLSLVCPTQKKLMFAWCQELFDRAHYRYEVKVFLNQQLYMAHSPDCAPRPLAFVADPDAEHWQYMVPCFGRHEPVQTSPHEDDFASAFLLAATPDQALFYVFRSTKLGPSLTYTLYEEITDMAPDIPPRQPCRGDLVREELLQTVRTVNLWIPDVQRTYLNEVVIAQQPIQNILQGMRPQDLYFMCIYALRDARFKDPAFVLDERLIKAWDGQPLPMDLYFDYEHPDFSPFPQLAYPCYGRHQKGAPTDNQKFLHLYRISSGYRKNSLLVYRHVVGERVYGVLAIYENLDLREIRSPGPAAGAPAAQMTGQPGAGLQVTSQQMANLQLTSPTRGPSARRRPRARRATPTAGVPGQRAGQLDPPVLAYASATPDPRQFAEATGSRDAQFDTPLPGPSYAPGYSSPGSSYDPGPYLGTPYAAGSYPPQPASVEAGASSSFAPYQLTAPYASAPYPQVDVQAGPSSSGAQPPFLPQSEESYPPELPYEASQEQALPYIVGQSSEQPYELGQPYYMGNPSLQQQEPLGGSSYYPQSTSTADESDPLQTSNQSISEKRREIYQEIMKRINEQYRRPRPGND